MSSAALSGSGPPGMAMGRELAETMIDVSTIHDSFQCMKRWGLVG